MKLEDDLKVCIELERYLWPKKAIVFEFIILLEVILFSKKFENSTSLNPNILNELIKLLSIFSILLFVQKEFGTIEKFL